MPSSTPSSSPSSARLPADAQETVAAQKALAHAIAAKRAKARPGDIFRPEVEPVFRRLIAEQLEGPDAVAARKAVLEGNPEDPDSVPVVVRVNAEYPPGAPRSTVPAEPAADASTPARVSPLPLRPPGPGPGRLRGPAHRGLPAGRRARPRDQVTPMTHARTSRLLLVFGLALCPAPTAPLGTATAPQAPVTITLTLPRKDGSVRFAVMGDTGTGDRPQYDVAKQMVAVRDEFPFAFVIMLGDNIIGSDTPEDMRTKFETPYKPLLDAGVVFHAVLGNHDNPNQRFYALFNMGGERYYTFQAPEGGAAKPADPAVRFFALDTDYLDKPQLDWLEKELSSSSPGWKILFFHHPLYSSGGTHGSALESRAILEPLFVKYGVSVVFSGHDHIYERIKPQKGGIVYWVAGAGGRLRTGDLRATDMTAKGFDRDNHFMIVEISGDDLYFQAISRTGETVDSGVVRRPGAPAPAPPPR